MKKHLAIDIGADTGRAIVGELKDGVLQMQEIHRFPTRDFRVRSVRIRNVYRWYEEIMQALSLFKEQFGNHLDTIGVDALGCEFSFVDLSGSLLNLPLSTRDDATFDHVAIIDKEVGRRRLYELTGNQIMPVDTLNRILYYRENDANLLYRASGILFLSDIMHYFLGSQPCCEYSLATYCHLYDQNKDCWSNELFSAFDLPKRLRPQIVHAGDIVGRLDSCLSEELGFDTQPYIVTPCSHDTSNAVLCVPDLGDNWAFISSGSWSLIGFVTDNPIINDRSFSINASNSALAFNKYMYKKNVSGMWLIQQCSRYWGIKSYSQIAKLAHQAKPLSCWIDIDSLKFFYTNKMPEAVSLDVKEHYGVDVDPNDTGAIARIIYESMAMKDRYVLERVLSTGRKKIKKIYIVGGGSKNTFLNQLIANITGYEVRTGASESTSIGNLLLQCVGSGELADLQELTQVAINSIKSDVFTPEEQLYWDAQYKAFLSSTKIENIW